MGDVSADRSSLVRKRAARRNSGCCVCDLPAVEAELTAIMGEMVETGHSGLGIPSITRHLRQHVGYPYSTSSLDRHLSNCRAPEWNRAKGRA